MFLPLHTRILIMYPYSLLFVATSGISLYDVMQHRRDGTSVIVQSGYQKTSSTSAGAGTGTGIGLDAHSKDAWSADTGDLNDMGPYGHHDGHDEDDDDDNNDAAFGNHGGFSGGRGDQGIMAHGSASGGFGGYGAVGGHDDDDEHALLGSAGEPGRRPAGGAIDAGAGADNRFNEDTSYHAGADGANKPPPLFSSGLADGRRYDGVSNTGYPPAGPAAGADPSGKIKFPAGNYSFSG